MYHHYRLDLIVCTLMLLATAEASAQGVFRGVLHNGLDSSVIPFASIRLKETKDGLLTDEKGAFKFVLPKNTKHLTLEIFAIGVKTTVSYSAPFVESKDIFVDVSANTLGEFALKGLSAEDVVRMAVSQIPVNYADSSYFDYSFYRRYQKLNGHYVNLFEAAPVVMFRLEKNRHQINSRVAFAVAQKRRSHFIPNISNVLEDNPADLLELNPIYHLRESSLNPNKFISYKFSFDTSRHSADYVIKYSCSDFSTDKHGILDYDQRDLKGEEEEAGELIIDRTSFAIKKFIRNSCRHEDFSYYFKPNNVKFEYHRYEFEFLNGNLQADYEMRNGKWYLKSMFREYAHNFIIPVFETLHSKTVDYFE
jgi:hypothetical protein